MRRAGTAFANCWRRSARRNRCTIDTGELLARWSGLPVPERRACRIRRSFPHELVFGELTQWARFRCPADNFGVLLINAIVERTDPVRLTRRTDLCYRFVVFPSFLCSISKRTIPSSRPRSLRGRAHRLSAAVRPARQRFTLDGREHDGSVPISWGDDANRGDFCIINAAKRCNTSERFIVRLGRLAVLRCAHCEQPNRRLAAASHASRSSTERSGLTVLL
jgi:hypothetical protein